ncbi:LOW QUALITY PROTEIN: putative Peroxidase 48 [Primulina tabacum]|uniref:LOW QUALITY PROTEIN: putative Peroxidase 48 n=1 Tax=Primulina tabacum TaxID=48773 RepID=UPI003F5A046A
MDFTRKLSFLVFLLCVLISLKNQNAETNRKGSFQNADYSQEDPLSILGDILIDIKLQENDIGHPPHEWLRYDYYNESCPFAEQIIRSIVRELYELRPDVAPALLRLSFHDCFVEGCDAPVLLDASDVMESEKDSPPNESLKGFDVIDIIKSELEESCPGVVSCADIIVLAARESVLLAGGPFYPLYTGRKDSTVSFFEEATYELPSPQDDLSKTIESFATRGFDERETVSLLGAHSAGTIHCKFFHNRLYNFSGTDGPDSSLDTEFLELLRSTCNQSHAMPASSPSPSPSFSFSPSPSSALHILTNTTLFQDPGMKMDYEGHRKGFGILYYRSLLQGKGLLFVDQQMTSGEETETWVRAYASDGTLFQRDFGLTMIKLSDLGVLTSPMGQVRLSCRKVN